MLITVATCKPSAAAERCVWLLPRTLLVRSSVSSSPVHVSPLVVSPQLRRLYSFLGGPTVTAKLLMPGFHHFATQRHIPQPFVGLCICLFVFQAITVEIFDVDVHCWWDGTSSKSILGLYIKVTWLKSRLRQ